MSRSSLRKIVTATTGLAIAGAGVLVAGTGPASATTSRSAIVSAATSQLGANGCSPNIVYEGRSCGENWCADFAKWAWQQGGVDVSTLGATVTTFVNYGDNNHTWHDPGTYTPQPGDAMIFGGAGYTTKASGGAHVGIVEKVNSNGTITEIGGNQSNAVTEVTGTADSIEHTIEGSAYNFLGYVSPVGASSSTAPRNSVDFDGDGRDDIFGVNTTGNYYTYLSDGTGHVGNGNGGSPGWNGFSQVAVGDFDNSGHASVMGIQDSTGNLYFFKGNSGGTLQAGVQVGSGFNGFTHLIAGHFMGTANLDIAAITPTGQLAVDPGNGAGHVGNAIHTGSGWTGITRMY